MANYIQQVFRFYNDDGSEAAATAYAAQDTNISPTIAANTNIVLRLEVANTTAGGAVASSWAVRYSKNGGAYTLVTTATSDVKSFNSTNLTDDGATTNRLTGGSGVFIAGGIAEDGTYDNGGSNFTIGNGNNSEFLYPLTLIYADLANGDTLDFRVYRTGSVLNTYTLTPRITIVKGSTVTPPNGPGNPAQPPPPPPPAPEPPPPPNASKIQVIDHTGRLSKNPAKWPAGLKEAIAGCCGCDDSSSSSNVPQFTVTCCKGLLLPPTLSANLKNTVGHDGGYSLRHYETTGWPFNLSTGPPWLPKEGHFTPLYPGTKSAGWYSDLIEDDCQSGTVKLSGTFGVSPPDGHFNSGTFEFDYTYKVYFYIYFGGPAVVTETGSQAGCSAVAVQLCYPTGTLTLKTTYTMVFGQKPKVYTNVYLITWQDQITLFGAGPVSLPGISIPGTLYGGGPRLNSTSSITGIMRLAGVENGKDGDLQCTPFLKRALPYSDPARQGFTERFVYGCSDVIKRPAYVQNAFSTQHNGTLIGLNPYPFPNNTEPAITPAQMGIPKTRAQIDALPHLEVFP